LADNTFHCRVVTPATKLVDDEVAYASVPAWDGLFGVLPGRAPLLARLGLGELKLTFPAQGSARGGDRSFLVDGGFVKMAENSLTILAERAIPAEELTVSEAEAEVAEAQARTVPADATDVASQNESVRHERARAALKLRLAKSAQSQGI
jgi:F-type H+-transporting ATPase subunit epsilon